MTKGKATMADIKKVGKKAKVPQKPGSLVSKVKAMAPKGGASSGGNPTSTKTSTETSTKTSTVANPRDNVTVTGGAGDGDTTVHIYGKPIKTIKK